ncbi:hypothetical protein ILUMI_25155 [Ignelater luminosus]|uniref:Uncharacterized protein n=1 Tax=Ignelater luminosus TaxID=2038154 RepID=A0A8K0FY41_IGNLU|nr:hypothetical protein ILUMI_25155 [Ignelater luminosus]
MNVLWLRILVTKVLTKIVKYLGHQLYLIRMQNKRLSKRHVIQIRNTLVTANTVEVDEESENEDSQSVINMSRSITMERVSNISDLNSNVNRCNSKFIQDESDFNANETTRSIWPNWNRNPPIKFKNYIEFIINK